MILDILTVLFFVAGFALVLIMISERAVMFFTGLT
jgi:hypothetical protein